MSEEPKKSPKAPKQSAPRKAVPAADAAATPGAVAGGAGEKASRPAAKKSSQKPKPKPINTRFQEAGPEDEFVITAEELAMMASFWDGEPVEESRPAIAAVNNADGRSFWRRLWRRK